MTDREPVEITNLDRYGFEALPWSWAGLARGCSRLARPLRELAG